MHVLTTTRERLQWQSTTHFLYYHRARLPKSTRVLNFGYARTFLRESRKKTLRADNKARAIENRSPAR